jgi:hypothetical protein
LPYLAVTTAGSKCYLSFRQARLLRRTSGIPAGDLDYGGVAPVIRQLTDTWYYIRPSRQTPYLISGLRSLSYLTSISVVDVHDDGQLSSNTTAALPRINNLDKCG